MISERLREMPGVVGIVLGGSHATGTATPTSDIDFGLIYDGHSPFDLAALAHLCSELDDAGGAPPSALGGWGPWVDGGAWLTVQGQRVDFIYRDLRRIERSVQDALMGQVHLFAQVGHPHGIHAHQYAGELASAVPLHDPEGALAHLRLQVTPYPPALSAALQAHYGWQKNFWLDGAVKGEQRGDVHYVQGCLYQAVMALVQQLCAAGKVWLLNEKGALSRASAQPGAPAQLEARVTAALTAQDIAGVRALFEEF
ncbi:nucleotidyltransferase domain-containing protein [Deinococcus altitudinis]|uniref:nucleotidyltransferase domain-containing protein n=1 Tax=Deinococcus altitudinis TaxID=468914 RepID=UPI003892C072